MEAILARLEKLEEVVKQQQQIIDDQNKNIKCLEKEILRQNDNNDILLENDINLNNAIGNLQNKLEKTTSREDLLMNKVISSSNDLWSQFTQLKNDNEITMQNFNAKINTVCQNFEDIYCRHRATPSVVVANFGGNRRSQNDKW